MLSNFLLTLILLPVASQAQDGKSLLWKLSDREGLSGYLYGSVHLSDPAFTAWPEVVTQCFDTCRIVAGELNLLEMGDIMSSAKKMLMVDSTLRQMYPENDYTFVKSELRKRLDPMTFFMVDRVKPFFTLTSLYEVNGDSKTLALIPDYRIQQWAKEDGKKVVGLETFGEQMAVIDEMSYRDQAMILLDMLKKGDEFEELSQKMKDLYLSQDIEALLALGQDDDLIRQLETSLLLDRNTTMASRLDTLLKSDVVFCVVGAAHLAGEDGMLNKMRVMGYTVEPVYFEFEKQ